MTRATHRLERSSRPTPAEASPGLRAGAPAGLKSRAPTHLPTFEQVSRFGTKVERVAALLHHLDHLDSLEETSARHRKAGRRIAAFKQRLLNSVTKAAKRSTTST